MALFSYFLVHWMNDVINFIKIRYGRKIMWEKEKKKIEKLSKKFPEILKIPSNFLVS